MTTTGLRASAELLRMAVTEESGPDLLARALQLVLEEVGSDYGVLAEVTWTRDTSAQLHLLAQTQQPFPDPVDVGTLRPGLRPQSPLPITLATPATGNQHLVREIPATLVLEKGAHSHERHRYQAFIFGHPESGALLLVLDPGPVASGHRVSHISKLLFLALQAVVRLWQDAQLRESAEALLEQAIAGEDPAGNRLLDMLDHMTQGVICVDIHGYLMHISKPAFPMLGLAESSVTPETHISSLLSSQGRSIDQHAGQLRPALRWIFQQRTEPSVDDFPEQFTLHLPPDRSIHVHHVVLQEGLHALILSELPQFDETTNTSDAAPITGDDAWFQAKLFTQARLAEESRHQTEQLISTIARQLLDPVRVLQQSAERLFNDATLPRATQIEHLTRIDHTASRLAALVSDAVDYQLVAQATLRPETLDLDPLLRMTVQEVFSQMGDDSCSVGSLPQVQADPSMVIRAFSHLIQFSWDLRKPDEALRIRLSFSNDQNAFVLSDNGQGLDMAILQDLVKAPLLECQPTEKPVRQSGRSLAIARKIFDMHRGAFEVLSIVGVGTTYYFQLPLTAPESPSECTNGASTTKALESRSGSTASKP